MNRFKGLLMVAALGFPLIIAGCAGDRYEHLNAGNGVMYRIDKETGKMWFIRGTVAEPVTIVDASPVSEEAAPAYEEAAPSD